MDIKRIKDHNQPIEAKLKKVDDYFAQESFDLRRELIDAPMFHDKNYGYLVEYPSRVLARPEDAKKLMNVLEKSTSDWIRYERDKPNVLDELRRILTN